MNTQAAQTLTSKNLRYQTNAPYISLFQLRAAAYLYGINSPPLEQARVLELGYGTGSGLIPFALACPEAHIISIDLWRDATQTCQSATEDSGFKNLQYYAGSLTENSQDLGTFDYIIVHDTFTWAPTSARADIFRVCRENLSSQGIAYISYNTYPGWKAGDVLRDAILLHAHNAQSIEQTLSAANVMLTLMSDGLAAQNPQTTDLQAAVARLNQCPAYHIDSDFLQSTTTGFYFVEFASAAAEAGLSYIGDALPQEELSSIFGPNVQLNHSLIAMGQTKEMRQQYLDFAVNRSFRRSILAQQERTETILKSPDLDRFSDLRWATSYQWVIDTRKNVLDEVLFIGPKGTRLTLQDPYAIQIMSALGCVWPGTLSYKDLLLQTQHANIVSLPEEEHKKAVQSALELLFKYNALKYSLGKGPYDEHDDNPILVIPALVDLLSPTAEKNTTLLNLWHKKPVLSFSQAQYEMLALVARGDNVTDVMAKCTEEQALTLIPLINVLKRQGLLTGGTKAWLKYYCSLLASPIDLSTQQLASIISHIYSYAHTTCTAALQKSQPLPPQQINHFVQLRSSQNYIEAANRTKYLTSKYPDSALSWELASIIASDQNLLTDSLDYIRQALAREPAYSRSYAQISNLLNQMEAHIDSRLNATRALNIDSLNSDAWNYMGNYFRALTIPVQAEICYKKMLDIAPKSVSAHTNLSVIAADLGNIEEAVALNEKALEIEPNNFRLFSNQLLSLSQLPNIDPQRFIEAHKEYGRRVEKSIKHGQKYAHKNSKDPKRKLRVGFVSGDLRNHAVANFIEPIWQSIDKNAFELYAYSTSFAEDDASSRLKNEVTQWTNVATLDNTTLATQIRNDAIDILFDLSSHTAMNRLPMFALKPAPIQISWIGYPATTGLTAMDYYLTDKNFVPPGQFEAHFTEKLAWLPTSAAFQPFQASPDVNPLPALTNGYFTFGSFNRISKINEFVYAQWARILHAAPSSKFLMANVYDGIRADVISRFANHGIEVDRLILCERTDMRTYLQLHNKVDLLLDTFPYSGGTTTLHALWMGVPTVTWAGSIIPCRTTTAALTGVGLKQFSAQTLDEYTDIASLWATQLPELAAIRNQLRHRMTELSSNNNITKHLEITLQHAWRLWCANSPPESFDSENLSYHEKVK